MSNWTSLLEFDGTNGSQSFVDNGGFVWTPRDGTTVLNTTAPKFGTASCFFSGSSGGGITTPDASAWHVGSSDYTIDFWIKTTSTAEQGLFYNGDGGYTSVEHSVWLNAQGMIRWKTDGSGGASGFIYSTIPVNTGVWAHVACVKHGSNYQIYINGVSSVSATGAATVTATLYDVMIGYTAGYAFTGLIDEFRFLNGTAAWTANFTPPTWAYGSQIPTPAVPTLISPINDDNLGYPIISVSWNASQYAASYNLQYSQDPLFYTGITTVTGITATWYKISGYPLHAKLFWRVSATNESGTSAYSYLSSSGTKRITLVLTDTTISSWAGIVTNGAPIDVECIGAGGLGFGNPSLYSGGSAGAGAYAKKTLSYVSGSSIPICIPASVSSGGFPNHRKTLFGAYYDGSDVVHGTPLVAADYGQYGEDGSLGGRAENCIGDVVFRGGNGCFGSYISPLDQCGGGAAGENGAGGDAVLGARRQGQPGLGNGRYSGTGGIDHGTDEAPSIIPATLYGGGGHNASYEQGTDGAQGCIIITYTPPGDSTCVFNETSLLSESFTDSAYHFVKLNIIRNPDTTITTKCTVDQGTELVVNDAADFLDTIFTALSIAKVANCFSGQPSVTPVQFFDFRVHKSVLTDDQLKFYYDNVRASGNKTLTQV